MRIDPIERTNLTLSAGAVAVSLAFANPAFAWSLAVGALIEAFNFRGLRRSAQFLFWGHIRSAGGWTGVYALRFLWLIIGIGAALSFGADPIGLVVGLSLIMPAAIFEAWRGRPAIDPCAPQLAPDDPEWEQWNAWLARVREEDDA
ncbi:MAG: ATP synthase subunit I [Myxococcales bacterium]|nr:ATP synthase subunit I [Myxococcales bacterium]